MREIKFRFWDSLEKAWMIDGRSETNIYDFAFKKGMNWTFLTKEEALERVVVLQFTGLKDKNGVEIYEGDILKAWKHNETEFIEEVKHRSGSLWFGNWNWIEFQNIFRNIEVVGNVFEDGDLLK